MYERTKTSSKINIIAYNIRYDVNSLVFKQ